MTDKKPMTRESLIEDLMTEEASPMAPIGYTWAQPAAGLTVGCGTCDGLPGNSGCSACGGTGRLPRPEVAGETCPWRENHHLMESCSCGHPAKRETREARAVRRQTAEEIALTIEAYIPEGSTIDCPCDDCALIRDLARLARDIGTQENS